MGRGAQSVSFKSIQYILFGITIWDSFPHAFGLHYRHGFLPSSLWPPLKGSFSKSSDNLRGQAIVNSAMIICMSCGMIILPFICHSFTSHSFIRVIRISWYDHLPQIDHSRCNLNWRLPGLGRYNIAYALDNKVCLQLRTGDSAHFVCWPSLKPTFSPKKPCIDGWKITFSQRKPDHRLQPSIF